MKACRLLRPPKPIVESDVHICDALYIMHRVCVSLCFVWTSMLSNIFLMPLILCEHLRVVCFSLISLRSKVLWVAESTLLLFTNMIIIHTSRSFFMTKRTCWKLYRRFFSLTQVRSSGWLRGAGAPRKERFLHRRSEDLLPACRWSQVSNGQVHLFHTLIKHKTHTPEPLVVAWVTASVQRPSLGNKTLVTTIRTYLWCALHTFHLYIPYTLVTTIRTYLWCALHILHLYLPYTLETVQAQGALQ